MDQELTTVVYLSSTWGLFESFSLRFIEFFLAASICTKLVVTDRQTTERKILAARRSSNLL